MDSYKDLSELYDKLIYEDINYDLYCNTILSICDELKIDSDDYLDLACGTGNISVLLGKKFKNVFLVDLSEDMLMKAWNKMKENKIASKIVCQDMSELSLNRKFDLITCMLDSTNYLIEDEDLSQYFLGVKNHLKDNGVFIFDINSRYKLENILGNNIFTYNSEDVYYIWENIYEDDVVEMNLTFFLKDGECYKRFDETHLERAYDELEIEEALSDAGLKVIKKLDNYSCNEINVESERITYVVKRDMED